MLLDRTDINDIKETVQKMVDVLNLKSGLVNVELVIDKNNKVWPIDVGARAGGNMIPDLLGLIFNHNVVGMAVTAAMGEPVDVDIHESGSCYATHNLHSDRDGVYQTIDFAPKLNGHIIKKCLYKKAVTELNILPMPQMR